MTKKILAILTGAMNAYIGSFSKLCKENNFDITVINPEEFSNIKNLNQYDIILGDGFFVDGGYSLLHGHSILYKISLLNSHIYRFLFRLTHLKKIKKSINEYTHCKKIGVVSNILKKDLVENYKIPQENIFVIPAGFYPPENNDNKKFKLFDYNNDTFTISMSAIGFVNKGGYTFLNALRIFRKMYPNIKIKANIIYPKFEKNLGAKLYIKLFNLDKIVNFIGFQTDMKAFYNNSHCYICPSIAETFGRVVTEAMYEKIPVIVGSNVGAADIIEDKINGFIFNPENNKALNIVKIIKYVYDNYNTLEPLVEKAYNTSKILTWDYFGEQLFYKLFK